MQQIEQETKLAEYQRISTIPLLMVGFVFIASFIALTVNYDVVANAVFYATWAIFIIDYLVQLYLAEKKWRFVTTHIPYLVALIIPVLRIWALWEVFRRLFWNQNSSIRDRLGLGAIFATLLIVVFGALLTLIFEAGAPGANILTYGEALWWASVTVTTVGYGDFVPVTVGGRIVGVAVFSIGVLVLAVLTAAVVHWFTEDTNRAKAAPVTDAVVSGAQDMLATVTKVASNITKVGDHDSADSTQSDQQATSTDSTTSAADDVGAQARPAGTSQTLAQTQAATRESAQPPQPAGTQRPDHSMTVSQAGASADSAETPASVHAGASVGTANDQSTAPLAGADATQLQILAELRTLNNRLAALEGKQAPATPTASPGLSEDGPTMKPEDKP